MNSLFGEFYKKFGWIFLELFETIWEVFWRCLGGFGEVLGGQSGRKIEIFGIFLDMLLDTLFLVEFG